MAGLTDIIAQQLFGELHTLAKSIEGTVDRLENLDVSVAANVDVVVSNATEKLHAHIQPLTEVVNQIATVVGKAAALNAASEKTTVTATKIENTAALVATQLIALQGAIADNNSVKSEIEQARAQLNKAAKRIEDLDLDCFHFEQKKSRAFSTLLLSVACLVLGVSTGMWFSPSREFASMNDFEAMKSCSVPGWRPFDSGEKNRKICGVWNGSQWTTGWVVNKADLH